MLLLGGVVKATDGSRGATAGSDTTNGARHFSGFYEAVDSNGTWKITHKIPFDSTNHIRTQSLHVEITPATGLRVVDTLGVSVGAEHGFAVRLNNAIQLGDVTIDGRPVDHVFGGGVLWMKAPKKSRASLVLTYSLEASRSRPADTTATAPAFGAFHNTDVWHPFFDYLSANDLADITAVVRIPSEYYLTTTVPQTDSVKNGVRTVYSRSMHSAFLLALIYDRDWQPRSPTTALPLRVVRRPDIPTLARLARRSHEARLRFARAEVWRAAIPVALSRRGAGPITRRRWILRPHEQHRDFRSAGGSLGSRASQTFAHETGHAWTLNATGLASNFLHEAWATFVEGLMLRAF